MVGLAEVFMDLERVINSLISWEYQRPRCGWGYIETRRPCQRLSEEVVLAANTLESDATQLPLSRTVDNVKYPHFRAK